MTASPLAVNHCIQSSMTVNSISHNHSKPALSPLLRPQALLMNPDVLVRATIAESLSKHVGALQLSALPRPTSFTASNRMAIVAALASQQEYNRQLHQQLLQLRQSINTSPVLATPQDDCGGVSMKVPVPVVDVPPIIGKERPMVAPDQQQKNLKFMKIGRPLMAPPRLATAIVKPATTKLVADPPLKRTATALPSSSVMTTQGSDSEQSEMTARPLKKRKLGQPLSPRWVSPVSPSKVILSSDELDFVEAAQRLQHSPTSSPKRVSPLMPPHPLLKNALKPPPTLNL